MDSYMACLCCESSVLVEAACVKFTHQEKIIGGICDECMTNVRTFRCAFTKDTPAGHVVPIQFQCLDVFNKSFNTNEPD